MIAEIMVCGLDKTHFRDFYNTKNIDGSFYCDLYFDPNELGLFPENGITLKLNRGEICVANFIPPFE